MVLAIATVGSIAALLDFSLEEAVVHFGTRALAENDVAGVRRLINRSLRLDVLVGLAVFILIAAVAGPSGVLRAKTKTHQLPQPLEGAIEATSADSRISPQITGAVGGTGRGL